MAAIAPKTLLRCKSDAINQEEMSGVSMVLLSRNASMEYPDATLWYFDATLEEAALRCVLSSVCCFCKEERCFLLNSPRSASIGWPRAYSPVKRHRNTGTISSAMEAFFTLEEKHRMNLAFSSASYNPSNSIIVQSSSAYSSVATQRDVFESHRHHIFSVAYYMTGGEREAEAMLGSAFIESFQRYARPSAFDLDRALLAELRGRMSFDPVPAMSAAGGPGLSRANVRRTDLEEAVWQLPALERYCFLMHDVEGSSTARIAGLLQTPIDAVQRILTSARIRVRSLLASVHGPNA